MKRYTLQKDAKGNFKDFPQDARLVKFDPNDMKFVALSRKGNATVVNATDSDWIDFLSALTDNGVIVEFVCGKEPSKWFKRK
ncbi:MAG: hypothetical protein AB7S41_07460 [Parvibaculaceae bacterium]